MLTFTSGSLSQIVCQMDGDAIPPNPVCSAPPLSEHPSLLLPLSSVTPSSANDGRSGQRRSGRIQEARTPKKQLYTDTQMSKQPSTQCPSPAKRLLERQFMVQTSQSNLPGAGRTRVQEKQKKFEIRSTAEQQNEQNDPKSSELNVSPCENVVEPFEEKMMQNPDPVKPDISNQLVIENASASKGWVIGPLFQSLRSKMASFTEIVMSPVKLLSASSPLPSMDHLDVLSDYELQTDKAADVEPDNVVSPEGQIKNNHQEHKTSHQNQSDAGETQTAASSYSKKLEFDASSSDTSEQTAECAINQKEQSLPDSVPSLQMPLACVASESFGSSVSLQSVDKISASQEPKDEPSTCLKTLPGQVIRNGSEFKQIISENKNQQSNSEINRQLSQLNLSKSNYIDSRDVNNTQPSFLQLGGDDEPSNVESCHLDGQSLQNNPTGGTSLDTQMELNPEISSVLNVARTKRVLRLNCHSQDSVKRKRMAGVSHTDDTKQFINTVSHSGTMKEPRASRRVGLINTMTDEEETIKPHNNRKIVLTRANRKGKIIEEILTTKNEAPVIPQIEGSDDPMLVCAQNKGSSESHENPKSSKANPSGSNKRQKIRKPLSKSDANSKGVSIETTVPKTSTEQAKEKPLSVVLVRADVKQLLCTGKRSNTNTKLLKRKLTKHTSSELPYASSVEPMTPDFCISQGVQRENSTTELRQPSKKSKSNHQDAVSSSVFSQTPDEKRCSYNLDSVTKEKESQNGKATISADPTCFKMTSFKNNPEFLHSQIHLGCYVQLNKEDTRVTDGSKKSTDSVMDEIFLTDSEIRNSSHRGSMRHASCKQRRADNHRRRCRVLHSRIHKNDEGLKSITMEDADLDASHMRLSETNFSRRLLRSYSCPEIQSLHPHESPWMTSLHPLHHSRTHASHHHSHFVSHSHKTQRRARRHTVCSVEVEREIAPLCLRKEVYPSRRSAPYDPVSQHLSPTHSHCPSTSLSALASCFLSSPLAFLSKKSDCRGAAGSPTTSSYVPPPSSSPVRSPSNSSIWLPPAFICRNDSATVSDTSSSGNPLQQEAERRQQSEEEDYGEDTSSSSQEFEDAGLSEEKALSDSEIKFVKKHKEHGKVSSIKIRKTLPKPQTNLTPMGLPKPIRLKKKEFSLEEIYTNKNFSKPPESRLETIFEVALNRKNGSESWFGPRRVKRFLEFSEVGEVRKPKKPLVGKAGTSSRKRRGGFSKAEASLSVQDVDSLLCAKLDELNLWMIHHQKDCQT